MIKIVLMVFSLFFLGCSGGGSSNPPAPEFRYNLPVEVQEDIEFSYKIYEMRSLTIENCSWLKFDQESRELKGVPVFGKSCTNFFINGRLSDGTITGLNDIFQRTGPYSIQVKGDPFAYQQWFLSNKGQNSYSLSLALVGVDLNYQQTLRSNIKGKNVEIVVSDSGVQEDHEDLKDNIFRSFSKNYELNSPYFGNSTPNLNIEENFHGTAVAGIIASIGWNGIGVRGVAPESKIIPYKFIGVATTTLKEIDQASGNFDIYNYSYGEDESSPSSESPLFLNQVKYGTSYYRNGKGSIYVKSAGNDYFIENCDQNNNCSPTILGNSNFGGALNTAFESIIVGAVNSQGKKSSYSSPGSNLWISSFGGEYGGESPAIVTTDFIGCNYGISNANSSLNVFEFGGVGNSSCNYTSGMNGTSAAAPLVSGSIALVLEKYPNLTWRQVKFILAKSAKKIDPNMGNISHPINSRNLSGHIFDQGWVKNNAGYWFNNYFGFGLLDVDNAMKEAEKIPSIDNSIIITGGISNVNKQIPDNSAAGTSTSVFFSNSKNYYIEGVQVKIETTHPYLQELGFELISPSGTKSILLNLNSYVVRNNNLSYDALFLTNAFFGEKANGNWTIRVIDGMAQDVGILKNIEFNWLVNPDNYPFYRN